MTEATMPPNGKNLLEDAPMALTNVRIKRLKPEKKAYKVFDGRGLYMEISPSGGRLWRLKYRFEGREKRLALGVYPEVTLAEAREKREAARKLLAQGIDPTDAKKAKKAQETAQEETLEVIAREWHQRFYSTWTPGHAARIMTVLETDVFPWIGSRPIKEVNAPELLAVARRVEARGALESAHRLIGNCGMVFRYAVATGRAERDPSGDLRGALPPAQVKNHPTITDPVEIGKLLRAMDGYEGSFIVRCALRLAPLVFVRPGELRHAEWAEFSLEDENPVWKIPGEKMKMRRPHIVPLSRQAVEIVKELQPLTGSGKYLFPSERTRSRPMSENTVNAALRRLGYSKEELTGHGFRAMASTLLNEAGWAGDIIEAQLSHAEKSKVRRAYNRAEYLPERKKMMQFWSDFLDGLRAGGKVLPFRRTENG
jgi:integrase